MQICELDELEDANDVETLIGKIIAAVPHALTRISRLACRTCHSCLG